jgi:hypothetical protein
MTVYLDTTTINNNADLTFLKPSRPIYRTVRTNHFSFRRRIHSGILDVSEVVKENDVKQLLIDIGFQLENPDEIISFISRNPEVFDPLSETKVEVQKYFPEAQINLYYSKDYEEGVETLNIQILHNLEFEKAIEKENQLFDNWFKRHYINLKGLLTIREYAQADVI